MLIKKIRYLLKFVQVAWGMCFFKVVNMEQKSQIYFLNAGQKSQQ